MCILSCSVSFFSSLFFFESHRLHAGQARNKRKKVCYRYKYASSEVRAGDDQCVYVSHRIKSSTSRKCVWPMRASSSWSTCKMVYLKAAVMFLWDMRLRDCGGVHTRGFVVIQLCTFLRHTNTRTHTYTFNTHPHTSAMSYLLVYRSAWILVD